MGIDLGRFKSKKDDEWADWLADDPVPAGLRARMREKAVQEASTPVVRRVGQPTPPAPSSQKQEEKPTGTHSVSIHISVPRIERAQFKRQLTKLRNKLPSELPYNLTYRQLGIGGAVLVGVLVVGGITLNARTNRGANSNEGKGVLSAHDQKPSFRTLSPSGDSAGKASEMKYNPEHKIVTFVDSIGGVDINVTEQALPDDFKDNTDDKVKKLAESFSANEVLSTANPTAYLGTSIKGPQSVVFHKQGLLIFIKSTKKIDNHDWASYITGLK